MSKKLVKIVLVTEVLGSTLQDAFPPQLVYLDSTTKSCSRSLLVPLSSEFRQEIFLGLLKVFPQCPPSPLNVCLHWEQATFSQQTVMVRISPCPIPLLLIMLSCHVSSRSVEEAPQLLQIPL